MIKIHVFMLIFSFFTVGCTTPGRQPLPGDSDLKRTELRLPARVEKEQAMLAESGFLYEDQDLETYLNEVVRRLQPPSIRARGPITVKVIKDPHLNAFVFPNGVIYVQTGILARLDNEAQLAVLLAHEMIHYLHRHTFKAFGGYESRRGGDESQERGVNHLSRVGDFLNRLGTTLSMAFMVGYSQALETEADVAGMALVAEAGYEPGEAIRLFEHLKREVETENIKEPLFFGSHPRVDKRIENCENFLKTNRQIKKEGFLNKDVFLEKTREVVLVNAFLELKGGRYRSARRGAEKYLVLKRDDARVYYLLGEIFKQKGGAVESDKVMDYYEKAISFNPMYPAPYRAIGLIHYKGKAWGLAKKAFESYLALSPYIDDRDYILEYLKRCQSKGV